ncbi:conserved hypothetical protein [Ricinus communis]|uniref:Uncharacterized protein n=1 Tax=Ricinus communis TaxID=3988 RepID=B9SPE3_RICCO|nr:conserved hypothetical protein [Ricinus communis]
MEIKDSFEINCLGYVNLYDVLKVPTGICDDVDRLHSRFWWGDIKDKNRLH